MRVFVFTGLIIAALLTPFSVSAKTSSAFGIKMQRCIVMENAAHTLVTGLNVVWYNSHQTPATEVDFIVRYHGTTHTLTDTGSFTYMSQINHTLTGSIAGVVWQGSDIEFCQPGRVVFATGRVLQ